MKTGWLRLVLKMNAKMHSKSDPVVILISSGKGGSGKTTLARNLLASATADGFQAVGLDLDEQMSLRAWSDIRDTTIADMKSDGEEANLKEIPVEVANYIDGVAALQEIKDVEGIDVIVVDTPSGFQTGDAASVLPGLTSRSNFILVPCRQSATDTRAVKAWYADALHESDKASIVLMGVRRQSRSCDMANNMLAECGDVCPIIIRDLEVYRSTDQYGLGVTESNLAREKDPDFVSLWLWLRRKVGLNGNKTPDILSKKVA
ncbi:ParA family protein [Acetobacter pasteurianus]|uniref:ParA family protein n=1 Tax=Acetobacter pasteurianus TaxID=438 RepID=UPI002492684C|nr:ParA family protein [Acetobacter pasteurianus]